MSEGSEGYKVDPMFSLFRTNLVSFRTFTRPLFPKPVSCPGLFCRFLQQDCSSTVVDRLKEGTEIAEKKEGCHLVDVVDI